jgi:hypothetical protein
LGWPSPAAVPVAPPDQEVPAGWVVAVGLVPAAGTSASSRDEGGSSVVASVAEGAAAVAAAVSPAGRPLEDSSVVYRMP